LDQSKTTLNKDYDKQIEEYQHKITEQNKIISELNNKIKLKDNKISDLEKEINKIHSSLTGNAGKLEKELHNLKINVIPKQDENISMLNKELKDKYKIIDELNYALDSLKMNKSELADLYERQIKELNNKINLLNIEMENLINNNSAVDIVKKELEDLKKY